MKYIWQFLNCLKFLFVLFIFKGCEQKPLILDVGENGLQLEVVSLSNFITQTEQRDTLNIGESFKLYVGRIDSNRNSQILLKINPDLLAESNVCNDSTTVSDTYIELRSTNEIYNPLGEDDNEFNGSNLGKLNNDNNTPQFSAHYISNLDSVYNWEGNSIYIDENSEIDFSELDSIPLNISLNQFQLKIHIDTLFYESSICEYENPVFIVLNDGNPNRLTEFFSSEFYGTTVGPRLNTDIEFIQTVQNEVNKYNILSYESSFLNNDDIHADYDDEDNLNGIFKSNIPSTLINAPNVITWEDTAQDIELIKLQLEINDIPEDSLGSINLFLHGLEFSNQSLSSAENPNDPAGDNWNAEDSTGTEANNIYNLGEYFEDCGIDQICDEDETGYFPEGTENNELYDLGEYFLDCGTDSLCDVDEPNYDPILNPDPNNDNYLIDPENDNFTNESLIDSFWVYTETEILDSVDCVLTYENTDYHNLLTESDSNLNLLDMWCGDLPNIYCTYCDTLIHYFEEDSTIDFIYTGTENNSDWDYEDANGNQVLDEGEIHEEFIDLGYDNFPEDEGNELNDPQENNGQWDFEDLNENGSWDIGEPHEYFTDCGLDNLCDIDEAGYKPTGKEQNNEYDLGEYFEDCGEDQICGEMPDIDDLVLDPNGDNWSSIDSLGTENNGIYDSLEFYRDWGLDQIQDSLELPIISEGGELSYFVGTNTWEFNRIPGLDTVFTKPEIGDNDLVVWVSSIQENQNIYHVTLSLHSMKNISYFEIGMNHTPFFETVEDSIEVTTAHTNYSIEPIDGKHFINDISAYKKSIIDLDSSSFHINYGDNYLTKIDIPELDLIIEENFNKSISNAKLFFNIDTSHTNYSVNEAGIKVILSKLNESNLDSFDMDKSEISSHIIKSETKIEVDFTMEMQKLLTGESENNGFILEASRESNNFSHLTFFNELDSLQKPKLEIMLIK